MFGDGSTLFTQMSIREPRMKRRNSGAMPPELSRRLGLAALALAFVVLGIMTVASHHAAPSLAGLRGTPVVPARSFTPLELTAGEGSETAFPPRGSRYALVFFGYTHCPDVC